MMTPPSHNNSVDIARNRLIASMNKIRRRGQWFAGLRGFGWIVGGATLLFVAQVTALGWWGGSDLRTLSWVTLFIGIFALTITALAIPFVQYSRRNAIAYRIGKTYPDLLSDVLSASQLAASPNTQAFSEALIAQHFTEVERKIVEVPQNTLFPLRTIVPPAIVLIGALGISATVYSAIPGVVGAGLASFWSEVRPPDASTKHLTTKAPVVGDLTLTLRYPEYLKRDERQVTGVSGGLVAPRGTTILLEGKSLVDNPVRGIINLPGGKKHPLSLRKYGIVKGNFVVGEGGTFSIALGTYAVLMEGPERTLEIENDAPPAIRILRPTGRVEIPENGEIDIEFEAEDDHRLRSIDLVIRGTPKLEISKTIVHLADQVRRVRTTYRWSPEHLRLEEETELLLELEARDNDTILGPKPGRSETLKVHIITPNSMHNSAVNSQIEALDSLTDLLARRLVDSPPSSRKPDEVKNRFMVLRSETEDVLGKTARLIRTLNQDPLTPKKVTDAFAQIRLDISNQLLYETRLHDVQKPDFKKRLGIDQVTLRLLENAILKVDDLIAEQQLSQVVHAGDTLEKQHESLALLLSRFKNSRADSTRRSILDLIKQLEDGVRRLNQNMEEIRSKVQDTFFNPSSLRPLDLAETLRQLRQFIADDNITAALKLVTSLESDLNRLMAGLEGGLLSFRTSRFGESERFIGELFDRVMSIEALQLQVRRETTALQRRYQERLVEVMGGKIDPLIQKQLERLKRIGKSLDKMVMPTSDERRAEVVRVRIATRELTMALRQGDLDEAAQAAIQLAELAEELKLLTEETVSDTVANIHRLAVRMQTDIQAAYPRPKQLLSNRDRRLARHQATSQRALLHRTLKLRGWATKEGEKTRFLSHRAARALQTVSSRMSEAVTGLENKAIRQAISDQSAALDELASLREDLKHGEEVAPLESRPMLLKAHVELPDPEDYVVPPEFRKDILEAMHGDFPSQYNDPIRKYYETLVK